MPVDTILKWGVQEIITKTELELLLKSERPLNVKLGVDPTSPDLHLGHAIVLRKLRQFQELGHQTFLVIGDFTASIGDPSGTSKTRPTLTEAEIRANMETYLHQAGLVLELQQTHIVYNSEWLQPMTLGQFIGFASQISLANLIERADFSQRLKDHQPLGFHELFYPLTQAIDSMRLEIDVEIGGWDQRLNMLMGRELQKKLGKNPQAVVCTELLVGLDGERKMSKSFANYIGLAEPAEQMFGKLMRLPDKLIANYAELAGLMDDGERKGLPTHPRQAKAAVAKRIVTIYHGAEAADEAEAVFDRTFRDKNVDESLIKELVIDNSDGDVSLLQLVTMASSLSSSDARRVIEQKGVKVNGQVNDDPRVAIALKNPADRVMLQVGKHRFFRIRYK